jgi:hypothetical protein
MININRFIAAAILGNLLVLAGIKPGVAQAQESAVGSRDILVSGVTPVMIAAAEENLEPEAS